MISAGAVEVVAEGAEGAEIVQMDEAIEPEAEASASIAAAASVATAAAAFAASTARPAVSGRGSSAKLPNTAPAAATRQGSKYLGKTAGVALRFGSRVGFGLGFRLGSG